MVNILGAEVLEQDLVEGFIYGSFACFVVGPVGFLIAALTSILWALGGAGYLGYNAWRRVGCPIVLSVVFLFTGHSWALSSGALQYTALTIGYGIPSKIGNPTAQDGYFDKTKYSDPGSAIGRFWYTRFSMNATNATVASMITWFSIIGITMSLMFVK